MVSVDALAGGAKQSGEERRMGVFAAVSGYLDRRRAVAIVVAFLVCGSMLAGAPPASGTAGSSPVGTAPANSTLDSVDGSTNDAITDTESTNDSIADDESGPADHHVVVRFGDDRVVTGAAADETPANPRVSANGVDLVVQDGAVVTENGVGVVVGNRTVRTVSGDPDVVVTDGEIVLDTLRVNESSGVVETVEGSEPATTQTGDVVVFDRYDETNFVPEIADVERVGEGETVTIAVNVTNVGYGDGSADVRLDIVDGDGGQLAEVVERVDLPGGESTTVPFEYETTAGDHAAEEVIVVADTYDIGEITIDEAKTTVSIADSNRPAAGEELEVTVDIERQGAAPGGATDPAFLIEFWVDGSHVRTEAVTLGADENATETFTYRTDEDDPPDVDVEVKSGTDADSVTVPVRAWEPVFEVRDLSTSRTDGPEPEVTLSATVTNAGIESGEQHVEFRLDGTVVHVAGLELAPDEERTISTAIPVPDDAGAYDFAVVTADSSAVSSAAVVVGPDGDDAENESATDGEPDAAPSTDDGVPWYLVLLGVLGVGGSAVALVAYRGGVAGTARSGTLTVHNELPRAATVRVRCRTPADTVVLEDLQLQPDERRDLGSLPRRGQFTVGAGVEDIAAHEEAFRDARGGVGVVLRAEGILIANLGGGRSRGRLVSTLLDRYR